MLLLPLHFHLLQLSLQPLHFSTQPSHLPLPLPNLTFRLLGLLLPLMPHSLYFLGKIFYSEFFYLILIFRIFLAGDLILQTL